MRMRVHDSQQFPYSREAEPDDIATEEIFGERLDVLRKGRR